jgi:hypothetical protein
MLRNWLKDLRKYTLFSCAALLAATGVTRADETAELKARLEAQEREIQQLKALIQGGAIRPAAADSDKKDDKKLDDKAVEKIVDTYLKEHPGAGMPSGVQTGYSTATGFAIRSPNDPKYVNWADDCKIPFELRIRGRIQLPYYFYKVTDSVNHLTNVDLGRNTAPDFSSLEAKRARVFFEGTAFDPNLRYGLVFDGNTRGIAGLDPRQGSFSNPIGNVLGGQADANVDHAVRLFSAYVAYDFHPTWSNKGCAPDCPEGTYSYQPTYTAILGKIKPFFGLEEYLGSGTEHFVEYSMADWFFDADDDNYLMAAGVQVKAFEDRLYAMAVVTNGNETQIPNLQLDNLPGFNAGFWWDFGGNWNEARKRWDLFGDGLGDIDYSCQPVVRVGGAVNLVPMGRRSLYTSAELDRVRAVPGQPNAGGQLDGILGGAGVNPATAGVAATSPYAVDAFDSYSYDAFIAAKWRGFSLYNEWWLRNLNNFRGEKNLANGVSNPILYNSNNAAGTTFVSLFPSGIGIIDFGTTVQGGYFIIPKKLELVGRYSWVRGQSGNINGNGTFTTVSAASLGIPTGGTNTLPAGATVRVVNGAFRGYEEASEYAVGINYFFKRHLVKWQTDLSFYTGGNPAANGQSAAGFIPGVEGWMVRSQIQLGF